MSLKNTFNKAADTVFKVFKSLIVKVNYIIVTDDGFDAVSTDINAVDMIIDSFSERDVQFLSFSALIQPTDVKGLVRGQQLRDEGVAVYSTTDLVQRVDNEVEYSVIAYSTDPAEALYTFLLRGV